jgi:cytochrome c-type biogenesis protein CcmH/NrfG
MISLRGMGRYFSAANFPVLAFSLAVMAAGVQQAPAESEKSVAGDVAHISAQRCRTHASVSTCDDALRWNPSDPSLLAAMGDALMRARRPADAMRVYQRAASLAPRTPGIEAKVQTAQALSARSRAKRTDRDASVPAPSGRRFSNSDPDTQTH